VCVSLSFCLPVDGRRYGLTARPARLQGIRALVYIANPAFATTPGRLLNLAVLLILCIRFCLRADISSPSDPHPRQASLSAGRGVCPVQRLLVRQHVRTRQRRRTRQSLSPLKHSAHTATARRPSTPAAPRQVSSSDASSRLLYTRSDGFEFVTLDLKRPRPIASVVCCIQSNISLEI
jgi:hypothetical protein